MIGVAMEWKGFGKGANGALGELEGCGRRGINGQLEIFFNWTTLVLPVDAF